MKYIILCADDYGLNASISQGILDLLQQQRLTAVSCMSTAPSWQQYAPLLKPFENKVDLGLHLNFTEGKPLADLYLKRYGETFFSLSQLLIRASLGQLDPEAIEQECELQLTHFVQTLGFLPNFIDGHQHIHQLPVIREALLRIYAKYFPDKKVYLRSVLHSGTAVSISGKFKQLILRLCGAQAFEQSLQRLGLPYNTSFAGIYNFSPRSCYAEVFPQFLANIKNGGLIMCHPALNTSAHEKDAIAAARTQEYAYFLSDQFPQACTKQEVSLVRGAEVLFGV